jgi:hypothetical protein
MIGHPGLTQKTTMKCESLQFDLPLYLDDVVTEEKRAAIDAHLPTCPLCRVKLDEYRALRNELRHSPVPEISAELLRSVRNAVAAEVSAPTIQIGSARPKTFWEMVNYWLMPYSVGTVAALILTFALLTSLSSTRDAVDDLAMKKNSASDSTILLAKSDDMSIREEMSLPGDYTKVALEGKTPQVNPAGALFALTKSIVRGEMEDEEVVVVAEVFGNGLARISEIVDPPGNARAMRELEKAFQADPGKAPFLPPKLEPNTKAVRVVLKIQRVDVKDIFSPA